MHGLPRFPDVPPTKARYHCAPARGHIPMTATTRARIQRAAAEAVGSIPGIEAVLLFGSRARGTARQASDWDVVILSHAGPGDEQAARRLFGRLERVHASVMSPELIEEHCNQGIRIESAVARQGQLLAGDWTPPSCRTEDLDVKPEDFERSLDTTTSDLRSAFFALCNAAFRGAHYAAKVVEESQQAAETLAKTIVAGFGLSPATVHDLDQLADQIENAYRGRTRDAEERKRFAAAIHELDGNTEAAHIARYHAEPVEPPSRTALRLLTTCAPCMLLARTPSAGLRPGPPAPCPGVCRPGSAQGHRRAECPAGLSGSDRTSRSTRTTCRGSARSGRRRSAPPGTR